MQASLDLANSGFKVYLVEEGTAIGGRMAQLDKTFPTNDCSMCIISPRLVETARHLNIQLMTDTEVLKVEGEKGNFTVFVRRKPRYIDVTKCTGCSECAQVCPVIIPGHFDEGMRVQRAAYKLYPQAVPNAYAIEKKASRRAATPVLQASAPRGTLPSSGRGGTRMPCASSRKITRFPAFAAASVITGARTRATAHSLINHSTSRLEALRH